MKETCANCEGIGKIKCEHCGGSGLMPEVSLLDQTCRQCQGTGQAPCPACNGVGALPGELPDPWEKARA